MNLKRSAERQETVDVDVLLPDGMLPRGDENEMSTCLTSLKYQENGMHIVHSVIQ